MLGGMIIHAQVVIPHKSGFSEDAVVNTFAVSAPGFVGDNTDLGEVTIPLAQFYTRADGLGQKVGSWLGHGLSRTAGACQIKLFDITAHLNGSPHGSPFATDFFTLPAPGVDTTLPEEVALAITTRADGWQEAAVELPDGPDAGSEVDRIRQRLSGRIYVGPLTGQAFESDAGFKARPKTALRDTLLNSLHRTTAELAANGHALIVWSRKNAGWSPVSHLQVDNAFDTQRRRGPDPTVRTTRDIDAALV